jgi:hypothetical protein
VDHPCGFDLLGPEPRRDAGNRVGGSNFVGHDVPMLMWRSLQRSTTSTSLSPAVVVRLHRRQDGSSGANFDPNRRILEADGTEFSSW